MTAPDPKWLEILKASGWHTLAICGACCAFLIGAQAGLIPKLDPWMVQLGAFAALVTGALTVTSIVSAVLRFIPPKDWLLHFLKISREKRWAQEYVASMTANERNIIGYLLHHNQRTFVAAQDGGYAMPLISNRIVFCALQPGQVFDAENTPFTVPPHIWKVLQRNKGKFPFDPEDFDGHPWRIHWMAR